MKGGRVNLEVLVRAKDAEENAKQLEKCVDVIKGAGVRSELNRYLESILTFSQNKVGVLPKDAPTGPFADDWKKAYGDISKEVEEVDVAPALSSAAFAIKDENELVNSIPLLA